MIIISHMLDIYKLGDEVLYEPCNKVTKFDSALKTLVEAMFETMLEADGVGLAAPQIGSSDQIFVVDTREAGEQLCFINPSIIETSVDLVPHEEGCLSIPGVFHKIMRPRCVTIQAQDVNGKAFTLKASGLLARVIQHEYDHLSGRLFIDHLPPEEKAAMIKAYERKNHIRKGKRK